LGEECYQLDSWFLVKSKKKLSKQSNDFRGLSALWPAESSKLTELLPRLAQLVLALMMSGLAIVALLGIFTLTAQRVQAAPPPRPLDLIISDPISVTHTEIASATHQMRVFADGSITDQFLTDNDERTNQIGSNTSTTTIAILFDQHTGNNVDVGSQLEFSATTPITLNTTSSIPGYSEDSRVVYASQVLSYQVTQRTLATTTNNCVIMELVISNTGTVSLTGGKLLYMVDIQVGEAPEGDAGGFDPARRMVYQTDYNGGTQDGYAFGISLLEGDLRGYGVNGNGYPDPTSDLSLKTEMITPTNASTDGDDDVSWLVTNIPTLSSGQSTPLAFALCARAISGTDEITTENAAFDDMIDSFDQVASLSVTKTATPTTGNPITVGDRITYTITLSNTGNRYVDNIVLTDTVPTATNLITYSVNQGNINASSGLVTATIGRLYPSSDTVTVSIVVSTSLTATNNSVITNQAFIESEPIITQTNIVTHQILNSSILTLTKQSNSNWTQRMRLTFTNTTVSNLIDFPVLVTLDNSRINYGQTQNAGQDIRFVDPDGTVLAHEIEEWNESGTSYVWVKVPQIDSGSTSDYIWIYYGNAAASDGQDAEKVWDIAYEGVWHLEELVQDEQTSGTHFDSTTNNNDGSQSNNDDATGKIATGQGFDGNDYIQITGLLGSPTDITLGAWVNYSGLIHVDIVSLGDYVAMRLHEPITELQGFFYNGSSWSITDYSQSFNGSGWHYLVYTIDDSNNSQKLYVDGVERSSTNYAASINFTGGLGPDTIIGYHGNGQTTFGFIGTIDEVRASSMVRSSDWITAQYQSMTDNFIAFDSEDTIPGAANAAIIGGPVTYTLTISNAGPGDVTDVVMTDTLPAGANYITGGILVTSDTVSWTIPGISNNSSSQVTFIVSTCQTSLVNDAYRVITSTQGLASALGPPLLTLLTPPTVTSNFEFSPLTITLYSTVDFTSTSSTNGGPLTAWSWDFGEGSTGSGETTSHVYTTIGTYIVALTVTDTCGYTDTVTGTVQVVDAPNLSIAKQADPNVVQAGERLTYTLVVSNSGPGAATGIIISDTLPVSTTFVAATSPHTGPVSGVITWPLSTLNIGATRSVTVVVLVDSAVVSGTVITNTAWVTHSSGVTGTDTVSTLVEALADLSINKTAEPTIAVGEVEVITYTLIYTNNGSVDAQDIIITDTLPLSVTYGGIVSVTPPLSGPTETGRLLTWYTPMLSAGAMGTIVFTVTVDSEVRGILTNSVVITAGTPVDSDPTNNDDMVATTINLWEVSFSNPSYSVDESAGAAVITVTLSIISGETVSVDYASDDGTAAAGSDYTAISDTLTFNPGTTVLTFSVPITDDTLDESNETITLTLSNPTNSILGSNNPAVLTILDDDVMAVVNITKTGPLTATVGQIVAYTFTVSLVSGVPVTDVTVSDTIADQANYRSGDDGDSWLELGENWVYTASYTIQPTDPEFLQNTGVISGQDLGGNSVSATATHTTTLTFDPELFVHKTGSPIANIGDTVVYTFTVINVDNLSVTKFNLNLISIAAIGDGSPITITAITDDIAGVPIYISGDGNSNSLLDRSEGWVYTASYTIQATDTNPLRNEVIVWGLDMDNDVISATATHVTTIDFLDVFLPIMLKN
jgi:uncharacterized repeat protein (TIGR01451 family)